MIGNFETGKSVRSCRNIAIALKIPYEGFERAIASLQTVEAKSQFAPPRKWSLVVGAELTSQTRVAVLRRQSDLGGFLRDNNRGRVSECRTGRLEICVAMVRIISTTAGQIATCSVARHEFELIRARRNWSDDHLETAIAMNVGSDHAQFNRRYCLGYSLPRDLSAGATAAIDWKLAKGWGERRTEGRDCDLVEFAWNRSCQREGHCQFFCSRRDRPRDLAFGEVERFAEAIPS